MDVILAKKAKAQFNIFDISLFCENVLLFYSPIAPVMLN